MQNMDMQKIFYAFVCFFACAIFCALLPYPVLSNYTNVPESVIYQQNNIQEVELQPSVHASTQVLLLDFKTVNALLSVGSKFEVTDLTSNITFSVCRTGGRYHFDIEPVDEENFLLLSKLGKFSWERRPVVIALNDSTFVPASLSLFPHGYNQTENNGVLGHFCLHFKNSRLDGNKRKDDSHQKCVALAYKLKKKSLD